MLTAIFILVAIQCVPESGKLREKYLFVMYVLKVSRIISIENGSGHLPFVLFVLAGNFTEEIALPLILVTFATFVAFPLPEITVKHNWKELRDDRKDYLVV